MTATSFDPTTRGAPAAFFPWAGLDYRLGSVDAPSSHFTASLSYPEERISSGPRAQGNRTGVSFHTAKETHNPGEGVRYRTFPGFYRPP